VLFYGPGYVREGDLEKDARRVYDRYGPFDAALVHQYFLYGDMKKAERSCYFPFNVKDFVEKNPSFPLHFNALPCVRIAMLLRMDYYALTREQVRILEDFPGYFLSWPRQFIKAKAELPKLNNEAFYESVTDNYRCFLSENGERIIPFMHLIDDDHIYPVRPGGKKTTVCVPGHLYSERRRALDYLSQTGFRSNNRSMLASGLSRGLETVSGRGLYARKWGIRLLRSMFRNRIRRSWISFTDGSLLRWPIRKYFEIPAYGSLLVCDPFNNYRDLGFETDKNCFMTSAQELPEVVRYALSHFQETLGVIKRSQAMIKEFHSASVRVKQFAAVLDAIRKGSYLGARWQKGELLIRTQPPENAPGKGTPY